MGSNLERSSVLLTLQEVENRVGIIPISYGEDGNCQPLRAWQQLNISWGVTHVGTQVWLWYIEVSAHSAKTCVDISNAYKKQLDKVDIVTA